jgi:hypothetical protein
MFTKLPWWTVFLLSAGLTLIGWVVGDVSRTWVQLWLFRLGAALAVVGSLAAIWRFWPKSWLNENVLWRFGLRRPAGGPFEKRFTFRR